MASSLRRPRGSFLPKGNEPAGADPHRIPLPRVINVRGARVCNLLSSARAHCWQGFDARVGRRPANLSEVLMYHDSSSPSGHATRGRSTLAHQLRLAAPRLLVSYDR